MARNSISLIKIGLNGKTKRGILKKQSKSHSAVAPRIEGDNVSNGQMTLLDFAMARNHKKPQSQMDKIMHLLGFAI